LLNIFVDADMHSFSNIVIQTKELQIDARLVYSSLQQFTFSVSPSAYVALACLWLGSAQMAFSRGPSRLNDIGEKEAAKRTRE
jgi:hypothetical protein